MCTALGPTADNDLTQAACFASCISPCCTLCRGTQTSSEARPAAELQTVPVRHGASAALPASRDQHMVVVTGGTHPFAESVSPCWGAQGWAAKQQQGGKHRGGRETAARWETVSWHLAMQDAIRSQLIILHKKCAELVGCPACHPHRPSSHHPSK